MTGYVMGFAFDDLGRVVLTRSMNDKLAGLSTPLISTESPEVLISRHFQNTTDVLIPANSWESVGRIYRPDGLIHVVTATSVKVRYISPPDLSTIALYIPFTVPYNEYEEGVAAIVSLCQIEPDPTYGKRPTFVLNY